MKLWNKKMMDYCVGDQAILLAHLDTDKRCQFLENIIKMHSRLIANSKTLSSENGVEFFLEHTWLIFANPITTTRERDLFNQLIPIYEKILYECVD